MTLHIQISTICPYCTKPPTALSIREDSSQSCKDGNSCFSAMVLRIKSSESRVFQDREFANQLNIRSRRSDGVLPHCHFSKEPAKFRRRGMVARQSNPDRRQQERNEKTVSQRRCGDVFLDGLVAGPVHGCWADGAHVHEGVLLAQGRERDLCLALHAGVQGRKPAWLCRRSTSGDIDKVEGLVFVGQILESLRRGDRVIFCDLDIVPAQEC